MGHSQSSNYKKFIASNAYITFLRNKDHSKNSKKISGCQDKKVEHRDFFRALKILIINLFRTIECVIPEGISNHELD